MSKCGNIFTDKPSWQKGGTNPPARKPTFSDSATPIVDVAFVRGNLVAIKQDGTRDTVILPKPIVTGLSLNGSILTATLSTDQTIELELPVFNEDNVKKLRILNASGTKTLANVVYEVTA